MVMPLPMHELRHIWRPGRPIGQAFMWAAQYRDGSIATEERYGSLRLVPRDPTNPIVALAVVATNEPEDVSRHYRVHVPDLCEPFCFRRNSRSTDGSGRGRAITVLGYTWPNGHKTYLWIYDDGRAVVTDRDLYDLV